MTFNPVQLQSRQFKPIKTKLMSEQCYQHMSWCYCILKAGTSNYILIDTHKCFLLQLTLDTLG